jgi:hypothetical protein
MSMENMSMYSMLKRKYLNVSIYLFISVLVINSSAAAYAGPLDSSAGVVSSLYRDFAWEAVISSPDDSVNLFGPSLEGQPKAILEKYFDEEIASLFIKNEDCEKKNVGEECSLDFDPIFASQDSSASDLTIKAIDSTRVEVMFTYPSNGQKIKIEYVTKKTLRGWRIVDIIYPSKNNESLKKILLKNP